MFFVKFLSFIESVDVVDVGHLQLYICNYIHTYI